MFTPQNGWWKFHGNPYFSMDDLRIISIIFGSTPSCSSKKKSWESYISPRGSGSRICFAKTCQNLEKNSLFSTRRASQGALGQKRDTLQIFQKNGTQRCLRKISQYSFHLAVLIGEFFCMVLKVKFHACIVLWYLWLVNQPPPGHVAPPQK